METMSNQVLYPIEALQSSAKLMPNGLRYFHFYGQVGPGKYDTVVKTVKDGEGYDNIETLIKNTLRLHRKVSSQEELDKLILQMIGWVNIDFGKGFGTHYPDLRIVAWVGPHETQKPIVSYIYDGKKKYISHPQFDLMVQSYELIAAKE
jgi:hypothetical protein